MKPDYPFTPKAKRCGAGWLDLCPAHDDRSPSLSISTGRDGRLRLHCFAGCSHEAILEAAGLGGPNQMPRPSAAVISAHEVRAEADRFKRVATARSIWAEAHPLWFSLSEEYLARRGLKGLKYAQRHHPALYHSPSGRHLPALVSRITRDDRLVGVHRVFLDPEGNKREKMMLGDCRGGAVRLTDGPGRLFVGEGVETTMALRMLHGDKYNDRYWAATSAFGMANLKLPEQPGELVVAADGDPAGRNAANQLAFNASFRGWKVDVMSAPDGTDWNDVLLEKIRHAR